MLPLIAAVFPVLILFCGLTVDVGLLEWQKIQMQTAADAGALAAELELERGTGNWVTEGKLDASVNGYTDGSDNTVITVAPNPTQGPYTGRYDAIQVTISHTVQTLFMGMLNSGLVTLKAQAVALVPPCEYFLDSAAAYSLALAHVNSTADCPVYVNQGMSVDGESTVNGMAYNLVGPSSASSVAGDVSPTPNYNVPLIADPLASLAAPSFTSCYHPPPVLSDPHNTSISYQASPLVAIGRGVYLPVLTLSPGTYCNGISLSQYEIDLNPGLYIITGGVNWVNSYVKGTGVTLFFTDGGGSGYGQVLISGNSSVVLSAANDASGGGIPTVLFFFDRNWVPTAPADLRCNGSFFVGDGIWYSTVTGFSFTSCSIYGANYISMVVSFISFTSEVNLDSYSFDFVSNYSNVSGGNPFRKQAVLVQ